MKKLLGLLLSALMLFCFAGCSAELTDEDYQAIYDVIEDVIAEEADSWDSEENYEDADDITAYENEDDGITEEPDISEAPEEVIEDIDTGEDIPEDKRDALIQVLEQDPRPHYHDDPERIYGIAFAGMNVKFKVAGKVLTVTGIDK